MKKIKILNRIIISALLIIPMFTFASTAISLSPNSGTYSVGKTYSVNLYVNPQGSNIYTVKLEAKYPADLLEVTNFTFANGLTPLSQTGYDLIDNGGGIIIKTAGYSGGSSVNGLFGTITFHIKKAGQATVEMTSNSQAFDENNTNVISSLPKATFTFTDVAVVTPPIKTTITPPKNTITASTTNAPVSSVENANVPTTTSPQVAAVVEAKSNINYIYWILGLVAILGVLFWFVLRKRNRSI